MKAPQSDSFNIDEHILLAITDGDLHSLTKLVEENPETMMAALERSIRSNRLDVFQFLLEKCQRECEKFKTWEISSTQKQNFLHIAAAIADRRDFAIVQYLVEKQATPILIEAIGIAKSYTIRIYLENHYFLQKPKAEEPSKTKPDDARQKQERLRMQTEQNEQLWLANFVNAIYSGQIKTPQEAEKIILQLSDRAK